MTLRRDRSRGTRAVPAVVAALAIAAVACGGADGGSAPAASDPTTAGQSEASATTTTASAAGRVGPLATTSAENAAAGRPGTTTTTVTAGSGSSSPASAAATSSTSAPAPPPTTAVPVAYPTGVVPARVVIPTIGVDAAVVELDVRGPEPEVPTVFGEAGWYRQTRLPGEIGPAVIAGHVDSQRGPAVFSRLGELVEDDRITVQGADGSRRTFEVTATGRYPKDALPPDVFGFGAGVPELRVLTCGGDFDRTAGHYRDNVVVYSRLVGS